MAQFNFTHLPGGGGLTGPIVTSYNLVINAVECVGTLNLFSCFLAVVDIFELVFELFFANIFAGRPTVGKDSATDDLALLLIPSSNPVTAMWGMGIRALEAQGIPISSSNPVHVAQFTKLAAAVKADMHRQFGDDSEFNELVQATQLNNPDSNRLAIQIRWGIDQIYLNAVKQGWIDPQTGFPKVKPPPPPPPPPQPGDCTDPCSKLQYSLLSTEVVPDLDLAASALVSLASQLGLSNSPANPNAIDRLAAALEQIEAVVNVSNDFSRDSATKAIYLELVCICSQLTLIAEAVAKSGGGGGSFDPQVAAQLKRIADDFDRALKPAPQVGQAKALLQL